MASTSEVGHAKNIANFQDLIAFVTGYGAAYNPTKASLKLANLITVSDKAQTNLADVITKSTAFNNAVNARVASFNGLQALSTRLVSSLSTTDASAEKISDAKGFNRKLQGKRASALPKAPDAKSGALAANTPVPVTISSSQQSYDQQIQHFSGLISVLQSEASYAPNETELKIATLTAKQADLTTKNNVVATAYTSISNSRITRDKSLYKPTSGLVDIATEVKAYIKAVFGTSSLEYAQVKGIALESKRFSYPLSNHLISPTQYRVGHFVIYLTSKRKLYTTKRKLPPPFRKLALATTQFLLATALLNIAFKNIALATLKLGLAKRNLNLALKKLVLADAHFNIAIKKLALAGLIPASVDMHYYCVSLPTLTCAYL
jgi:hypothetical protein